MWPKRKKGKARATKVKLKAIQPNLDDDFDGSSQGGPTQEAEPQPSPRSKEEEQISGVWKSKVLNNYKQNPKDSHHLLARIPTGKAAFEAGERQKNEAIKESMIKIVDRMFDNFQNTAYEFNRVTSGSELELTWIRPTLIVEELGTWHESTRTSQEVFAGRISTRYWTLAVRGTVAGIGTYILPSDKLLGFSTSPSSFGCYLSMIPDTDGMAVSWLISNRAIDPDMYPSVYRALLDGLIRYASDEAQPGEVFRLEDIGFVPEAPEAPTHNLGYQESEKPELLGQSSAHHRVVRDPRISDVQEARADRFIDDISNQVAQAAQSETDRFRESMHAPPFGTTSASPGGQQRQDSNPFKPVEPIGAGANAQQMDDPFRQSGVSSSHDDGAWKSVSSNKPGGTDWRQFMESTKDHILSSAASAAREEKWNTVPGTEQLARTESVRGSYDNMTAPPPPNYPSYGNAQDPPELLKPEGSVPPPSGTQSGVYSGPPQTGQSGVYSGQPQNIQSGIYSGQAQGGSGVYSTQPQNIQSGIYSGQAPLGQSGAYSTQGPSSPSGVYSTPQVPPQMMPPSGVSAPGVPTSGVAASGVPSSGLPAPGIPSSGIPGQNVPLSGTSSPSGMPPQTVPPGYTAPPPPGMMSPPPGMPGYPGMIQPGISQSGAHPQPMMPPGFPGVPPGMAPQGMPPGIPQQSMPPQPPGMSPPGMVPKGISPPGMVPPGMTPPMMPMGMGMGMGMTPPGMSPPGPSPSIAPPQGILPGVPPGAIPPPSGMTPAVMPPPPMAPPPGLQMPPGMVPPNRQPPHGLTPPTMAPGGLTMPPNFQQSPDAEQADDSQSEDEVPHFDEDSVEAEGEDAAEEYQDSEEQESAYAGEDETGWQQGDETESEEEGQFAEEVEIEVEEVETVVSEEISASGSFPQESFTELPVVSMETVQSFEQAGQPGFIFSSEDDFIDAISVVLSTIDTQIELLAQQGTEAFSSRDFRRAESVIKLSERLTRFKVEAQEILQVLQSDDR